MEKSTWSKQSGYIWSLIGSAVGFANVLSFSTHAYRNGGGAFLIPYCVALLLIGVPFLLLEATVGFKTKKPLIAAYGAIFPRVGRVLGSLALFSCLTIGGFYIVLTGYSVAYTYFSAGAMIPENSKLFFENSFLQVSSSLTDWGTLSLPVFLATAVVALVTWFVLVRGIRDGIEKVCSLFMPFLAVMMFCFAVISTFLPGGAEGWIHYLNPDFSKILNPLLWRDIFGQLFFSLSLGLGIVLGYSRHTGETINIPRAMCLVALGDFVVSFISGAAIFCCISHMSWVQGLPFNEVLTSDSTFEIGFVLFPQLFKVFGPVLEVTVGTLFFFCIFIAGITGVFSIVESVAGNLEVELRTTRKNAVTISVLSILFLSFFFSMGNGAHLIDALCPMVMGTNMLIGGLGLVAAFQYKSREFPLPTVASYLLKYLAPVILGTILIGNLSEEFLSLDAAKVVRWSWFASVLVLSYLLMRKSTSKVWVADIV